MVRGFWSIARKPMRRKRFRTRSRLIGIPLSRKAIDDQAATAAGIVQDDSIDHGHDPQRRFALRHRPLVQRGQGQAQEPTLAADAELGVVVVDQLSPFRGSERLRFFCTTTAPSAACRTVGGALPPWADP